MVIERRRNIAVPRIVREADHRTAERGITKEIHEPITYRKT